MRNENSWIWFGPHPTEKGSRERREGGVDGTRQGHARPCMTRAHTRTDRPAGRTHTAETVIPQGEMATKAPAQWYPFVKAVAIKGP